MNDAPDKAFGVSETVIIGGKEYTMSPPTLGMRQKLVARMRMLRRIELGDVLRELPECPERDAMVHALQSPVTDHDVFLYASGTEGSLYSLWLCLNKNHPELTYDVFCEFGMQELTALQTVKEGLEAEDSVKNATGAEAEAT